jgi:hypothetical protein
MNKLELAKKVVGNVVANVMDYDMHNLIPNRSPVENLEDAAERAYEFLPHKTLRERGYGQKPLFIKPDYSGDFLEKLRSPIQPKPVVESADETNLWDFSMPEEWLKHQEQPYPRNTLDEFYDINRPGEGAGADDLKGYWDRGWDAEDSPEMSEDKWLRQKTCPKLQNPLKVMETPFKSARNVIASFVADQVVDTSEGPSSSVVVASYLMDRFPIQAWMPADSNIRVAKLLHDLSRPMINTQTPNMRKFKQHKRYHDLSLSGISVRLKRAEPQLGRWTFTTGSGHEIYTTIFQFIPQGNVKELERLHVRVNCSCPSFVFWGAQFNAYMGDYLYGAIRPKLTKPGKRDPGGKFIICKHILAAIPVVSKYHLMGVPVEVKERLKRPPKIRVTPIREKLRIPPELRNFARQPEMQDAMRKWNTWSPKEKKDFIMGLESPGAVAFMAHRFPNTATVYVAEKLKDMALHHKLPSMRRWAKKLLQFWI